MNIEESKNQIETLIEAWQLDEADLNQTDINAMQVLLKENQELKSQLKGTTHCFDEEKHKKLSEQLELLTSKLDEYDLIVDERNQLKEQLENSIKVNIADHKYASECEDKVVTLEAHQKEFIKYLEDEIKIYSNTYMGEMLKEIEEVLQKYKEIIGVEDENKRN